jgi:hypothetical protein
MPQTTNAVPMACAYVAISILSDCSSLTDVSGSSNSITGLTQTKQVGEENTFDGNAPIVEIGKFEAFDMTVRMVFTNQNTEIYRIARDRFLSAVCDGKACIRYIPGGLVVGNEGFDTNYAPITSFTWPEINANEGGPVMTEFVLRVSEVDPFVYVS